ncbi:PLP-dependent transferase [Lentinus tigrinus ALCF2SS1-7]|uniref:PLP-dependent transferase n=1 Tax=Lentinus tigrinus ALCF2SS1-6 TaxID=1328759 RepID=A0A5C2SAQ4_9APHY|nr:PLP-dependent transferase [Lentinus tigrinus ALCF2SS1-6]RPD69509.1 PLP-dependent transferase [Lentinus tigrinus ALCF2SS1-7]
MSSTATVTQTDQLETLGSPVPPFTAHAISVSLPTWRDNVGYEEGEKRVVDVMVSGYPRFFIHLSIQKLARICEQKFGVQDERCLLCPTRKIAEQCRAFMVDRSTKAGSPVPVRLVQFTICPEDEDVSTPCVELHIVLFPKDSFPLAKQFWQHTGICISSRLAERCLSLLGEDTGSPKPPVPAANRPPVKPGNRHYSAKSFGKSPPSSPSPIHSRFGQTVIDASAELMNKDHLNYVEERYGRNLPLEVAAAAKRALRRRIAGVLVHDTPTHWSAAGGHEAELGPSTRGVEGVTEDDVFLYPTGMAAIWSGHQLALGTLPPAKSVCFGFPYTDSLKCLEKWGPGCYHFGHGLDSDIDDLEKLLEQESQKSSERPVLMLTTEVPSNPLLRTADLPRLRKLADKYDFLVMIDETLGNFVNVEVLPYADIVVSSLSKIFSGDANVMGGSLVLNPKGRHYNELKAYMAANFEDVYFDEDAIYMERNSRDFRRRITVIDANTLAVCELLHSRSLAAPSPPPNPAVKAVYYPKYVTSHNYDKCRVRGPNGEFTGGYGGLFSVTFTTMEASKVFFDTLPCLKGPSLGTNFTLASPYTILAHYAELDWAAGWGVEEGLVRVSVGMEDRETLLSGFEKALRAAEAVVQQQKPGEGQAQ